MDVLLISGSTRARSLNTAVLETAQVVAVVAPPCVNAKLYSALADLPAFNPDLEALTTASNTGQITANQPRASPYWSTRARTRYDTGEWPCSVPMRTW